MNIKHYYITTGVIALFIWLIALSLMGTEVSEKLHQLLIHLDTLFPWLILCIQIILDSSSQVTTGRIHKHIVAKNKAWISFIAAAQQ